MELKPELQSHGDITVPVYDVSACVTRKNGSNNGVWLHNGEIDRENEIVLGFSPTNYHSFIISGDKEFHSRFSFNRSRTVRSRRISIRAGVFIRIKGVPVSDLAVFQQYLQDIHGLRTPSCHIGTLQALENGLGIKLACKHQYNLRPGQLLHAILKDGLIDRHGNRLETSFYTTRNKSLSQIFGEVSHFERHFRFFYVASDILYSFWNIFRKKILVKEAYAPLMLPEVRRG